MNRILKTSFILVTLICLVVSCKKKSKSEDEELKDSIPTTIESKGSGSGFDATSGNETSSSTADTTNLESTSIAPAEVAGKYETTVTTKNGKNGKMKLDLKEEGTFHLEIKFIKENDKIEEDGTYTVAENGSVNLNGVKSIPSTLEVKDKKVKIVDNETESKTKETETTSLNQDKKSKTKGKKGKHKGQSINDEGFSVSSSEDVAETNKKVKVIKPDGTTEFRATGSIIKSMYTLAGTQWKLIELNGKSIKNKKTDFSYIVIESKDEHISGMIGCNTFSGNYMMSTAFNITFSSLVSGLKSCPNNEDAELLNILEKVDSYVIINGKTLQLNKNLITPVAKFQAVN